jgi:DNA-binding NarL/FixJ family response regulator
MENGLSRFSSGRLFSDDVPRKRPVPGDASDMPGSTPTVRRVLIVEDEFILALGIEEMVQQFGFAVCDCVATGPAAITAASRHQPDIVLMDVRLAQGSDGVEAAKTILARFGIRSIFISAHTDPATVSRMKDADPVGFLTKPCEPHLLAALLEKAFGPIN